MLKDYLLDVMQQHEHGLYMCELPTGNGKTYDSARAMKEYTDSIGNDTKIIYLTTLNKNLPEDALRAAYGSEELYKRNVLYSLLREIRIMNIFKNFTLQVEKSGTSIFTHSIQISMMLL